MYTLLHRCCIDKTSSSELSEAINSMFRWYQKAAVCYAYLSDVRDVSDLSSSAWFARGWTLQELIAPREVTFYAADWTQIGSRESLSAQIENICGVGEEYLVGDLKARMVRLRTASIARRMSWAASRNVLRTEDMAYCLLGIFDVNIPLIYGEGQKAFRRLQEEIIKLYPDDHSIYVWGSIEKEETGSYARVKEPPEALVTPLLGLLAQCPKDFAHSGDVKPVPWIGRFYRMQGKGNSVATLPAVIGKGIRIDLPVLSDKFYSDYQWDVSSKIQTRPGIRAIILCTVSKARYSLIKLPLISWGDGYFGRPRVLYWTESRLEFQDPATLLKMQQTLHVAPEYRIQPNARDIFIRELEVSQRTDFQFWGWTTAYGVDIEQDKIVRVHNALGGDFLACNFVCGTPQTKGLSVVLGRDRQDEGMLPTFYMKTVTADPPFSVLKWYPGNRGRHSLGLDKFESIPSPVANIAIRVRVERVELDLPDNTETSGFVDVLDLRIEENFNSG